MRAQDEKELFEILNKLHKEYVLYKVNKNNSEKNFEVEVYEKFIGIFGEEEMLNFSAATVSNIEEKLTKYNIPFKNIYSLLKINFIEENDPLEVDFFRNDLLQDLDIIDSLIKWKDEKAFAFKRQEEEKHNFKELIKQCKFISEDNIEIMMANLESSLLSGIYVVNGKGKFSGRYFPEERKIVLYKEYENTQCVITHEMLHVASTKRNNKGDAVRVGTRVWNGKQWMGASINEGITEYFSQRALNGKTMGVAYKDLVAITKDLVTFYGEENIFDAYLNSPNKLVELMEKDGVDYRDLLQMTDSYHKEVYNHKELPSSKARKQKSARFQYDKIRQFIEKIRENRLKENPELILPECETSKPFNEMLQEFGIEEKSLFEKGVGFLKNIRNVYVDWFLKIKETLLPEIKQVYLQSGEQQNNFKDSLKQENFKSEFYGRDIQQQNPRNERQNTVDIEKER